MKKNENIDILVGKIISREELVQKFAKLDSLDEIYEFCQSIQGGYTKEEFALFVDEMINTLVKKYSINIPLVKGMEDDDFADVSGGAKLDVKRVLAASLASLSVLTAIPKFNSIHAADPGDVGDVSVVQQEEQGTLSKVWSGVKAKLSSLKDMIIRNKGKVTIGALIIAAISICIYKRNDIAGAFSSWNQTRKDKNADISYQEGKIKENNDFKHKIIAYKTGESNALGLSRGEQNRLDSFIHSKKQFKNQQIDNELRQNHDILERFSAEVLEKDTSTREKTIDSYSIGHLISELPGLAKILALGGAAVTGGKTIWDWMYKGLGGVGSISKAVSDFNNARYSVNSLTQDIQYAKALRDENNNKKEFDRKEASAKLEEGLATVRGQEEAKKGVRAFFNSVTMERERLKAIGKKDSHAHIIYLNGPSGTGKSFTAGILASALSNATPYVMSASEVDVNSSKSSIIGQLFGDNGGGYGYGYDYGGGQQRNTSFVKYIQDHPDDGVVIINEYDKMCKSETENHPVDETLRTFIDEGKATINGKSIDCSGIKFILTGNELNLSTGDDHTGSLVKRKHDKSLLNRLHIVNFENLSAAEYNQITRDHFAPTIKFLKTDEGGNIDLFVSDESYDKVAKYVERVNEGARTIDKVLGLLFNAVVEKVSTIMKDDGEYIGKRFEAVYNDETNEFVVK